MTLDATKRKRAGIYLRVSTTEQTTDNQRPDVEQVAHTRGFEIVDVFEEKVSAAKHRPEYQRMLSAAHAGKLDVIVVWSIDRFGRSMVGNLQAVLELDRIGVEVVAVKERWLDSGGPTRSLLIAIISWVAEQERRRISERTKAGIERARRKGIHVGRPRAHINIDQALALRATGLTIAKTARKLGVGASTLRRVLKAHSDQQALERGVLRDVGQVLETAM